LTDAAEVQPQRASLRLLEIWTIGDITMFEGLFQPMHLLVIAGIALLVFGPKRLPELGRGLGEGLRDFKAAIKADVSPDKNS
jgi:sec-independent protein translocase protein TatA